MKIEAKKLVDFLNKVTLKGIIVDSILNFTEQGLQVTIKDSSNILASTGLMKKECFSEYQAIKIPIKSNKMLIEFLNSINGIVEFKTNNNFLNISTEKNDAELSMPTEEFVESNLVNFPSLNFDGGFTLNSDILKSVKKNSDILKESKVTFLINENLLKITTGEDNFDRLTIKEKVEYKNVRSSYGEMLLNLVDCLDGNINVTFNDSFPIQLIEKNDFFVIKWLIAPITEGE